MGLTLVKGKLAVVLQAIALIFIFGSSLYFGYHGQPTEMAIAVGAGAIALSFLNIDKIARFKGVGFEAEMRKAVEEAYATIETVKRLAKAVALFSINSLATANRYGGMSIAEKHAIKHHVDKVCIELGIQDPELDRASELFYKLHTLDHLRAIHQIVRPFIKYDTKKTNALDAFFNFTVESDLPSVSEIIQTITSLGVELTPEMEDAIENYAYYRKNRRLRRGDAV